MILYFSGTGNSEYVARRISEAIGDEALNLLSRLQSHDCYKVRSERPFIIVVPTYSWRIPHIIDEWLKSTPLCGNSDIYFVMTCGGNIGNAGAYIEKAMTAKGLNYKGCAEIVMPENYIAMFNVPSKAESLRIIDRAETEIDKVISLIQKGESIPKASVSIIDKLSSGIVNDLFYPFFVHAKKFYVTDACTSCGKCAKSCPLNNISINDGKPEWGKDCTHCMACICLCPTAAIEYGKHSKGQPRYKCPK